MTDDDQPLRVSILAEAARLTNGDRNKSYGDPYENHANIARLQNAYLVARPDPTALLSPADAAMLMLMVKVARIAGGAFVRDNYVDGAAYLGIAYECDVEQQAATPARAE